MLFFFCFVFRQAFFGDLTTLDNIFSEPWWWLIEIETSQMSTFFHFKFYILDYFVLLYFSPHYRVIFHYLLSWDGSTTGTLFFWVFNTFIFFIDSLSFSVEHLLYIYIYIYIYNITYWIIALTVKEKTASNSKIRI